MKFARFQTPDTYVPGASLLVLLLIGLHWAHPGFVIGQADLNPPFHTWNQVGQCIAPWGFTQSYLGQANTCFTWAPYLTVLASLQSIFGDAAGQAITLVLPLLFGWMGTYVLLRRLGVAIAAAFAAAWLYVLNPYTQTLIGVNVTALVFAALLPWLAWLIVRASDPAQRRGVRITLFVLCAFVVSLLAITPQFVVELAIMLLPWVLIGVVLTPERRAYLMWALKTLPWLVLGAIWWIVPVALAIEGAKIARPTNPQSTAWSAVNASLLNNLRFNPTWLWLHDTYFPFAQWYDHFVPTYVAGFALAALAVLGLFFLRGTWLRIARIQVIVALIALFIAKGAHPPFESINFAIERVPGLYVFQEPAGLIFAAILCFCTVAAGVLSLVRIPRARIVASAAAAIAAAVSAIALVNGAVMHGGGGTVRSMYVSVPPYWNATATALARAPGNGGVLVLPGDTRYDTTYRWGYWGADALPQNITARRVLLPGPPFGYFSSAARDSIYDRVHKLIQLQSPLAAGVLRDLGIQFILFRGDVNEDDGTTPAMLGTLFPRATQQRFGDLTLFTLPASAPVEEASGWIAQSAAGFSAGQDVELRGLYGETAPRIERAAARGLRGPVLFETSAPSQVTRAGIPGRWIGGNAYQSIAHNVAWRAGRPAIMRASLGRFTGSTDAPAAWVVQSLDTMRTAPQPAIALPSFTTIFLQDRDPMPAIFNPSRAPVVARVSAAYDGPAARLRLLVNARPYSASSRNGVQASFNGLLLPPGPSRVALIDARTGRRLRVDTDVFSFDLVRPRAGAIGWDPNGTHLPAGGTASATVASFTSDASLISTPAVNSLSAVKVETQLGYVAEIAYRGRHLACYVGGEWYVSDEIQSGILNCLRTNGESITYLDMLNAHVDWVGINLINVAHHPTLAARSIISAASLHWNDPYAQTPPAPAGIAFQNMFRLPGENDEQRLALRDIGTAFRPLHFDRPAYIDVTQPAGSFTAPQLVLRRAGTIVRSAAIPLVDVGYRYAGRLPDGIDEADVEARPTSPDASFSPAVAFSVMGTGAIAGSIAGKPFPQAPLGAITQLALPHPPRTIAMAIHNPGDVSVMGIGSPPVAEARSTPAGARRGFAGSMTIVPQQPLVSDNRGCDRWWIGVQRGHLVTHVCSDHWRNTFVAQPGVPLTILNVFDLLPLVLLILSIAGLAALVGLSVSLAARRAASAQARELRGSST